MTMTSLWRNFSGNAFANSNWSCLLISASEFHWKVQPTAYKRSSGFSEMHGALRAFHVSLNHASTRTVLRNNGRPINVQIWISWRYVWGAIHKAVLKQPSSKAQNNFWIKSCTGEDKYMTIFSKSN